jgi:hypothetical protein
LPSSLHPSTTTGSFGTTSQEKLDLKKQEFSDKFNQVRNGLTSNFSFLPTGGGSLPVIYIGVVRGVPITFDLSSYASQLSVIATALMFCAYFYAVSIVLD